jgi:hypothetical protein
MVAKKKTTVSGFLKISELKKLGKQYYALRRTVYDLTQRKDLNATTKKEVKAFFNGLTKARSSFSIARATNFQADSF